MGRIVIVGYRPKPGQEEALKHLMYSHVPRLRAEGLATDRAPILMQATDGTIVEVFEWVSEAAIEAAHRNPAVLKMWQEYDGVCDFIPVGDLEEAQQLFSEFQPVEFV